MSWNDNGPWGPSGNKSGGKPAESGNPWARKSQPGPSGGPPSGNGLQPPPEFEELFKKIGDFAKVYQPKGHFQMNIFSDLCT